MKYMKAGLKKMMLCSALVFLMSYAYAQIGSKPIYHTVQPQETLYRLSVNYNTTVENIKRWNGLYDNSIQIGQQLIVGYGSGSTVEKSYNPPSETYQKTPVGNSTDGETPGNIGYTIEIIETPKTTGTEFGNTQGTPGYSNEVTDMHQTSNPYDEEFAKRQEKQTLISNFNKAVEYSNISEAKTYLSQLKSKFPEAVHSCESCDGDGTISQRVTSSCSSCGGSGCKTCSKCQGSGKIKCRCGGTGLYWGTKCTYCRGEGMEVCSNCGSCSENGEVLSDGGSIVGGIFSALGNTANTGKLTCDKCYGKGEATKTQSSKCSVCKGVGSVVY